MLQVITRIPFPVPVPVKDRPDHIRPFIQIVKDHFTVPLDRPLFQDLYLLISLVKLQNNRGRGFLHVDDNWYSVSGFHCFST